jgi:seryl-tRNA synthetase
MLDITQLRRDLNAVVARLEARKTPQPFLDVTRFTALEAERKTLQTRTEELQAQRNQPVQADRHAQGPAAKGEDTAAQVEQAMAQVAGIADEMGAGADRLEAIQAELNGLLMSVPNLPQADVPRGQRRDRQRRGAPLGHPAELRLPVKDHVDLGMPRWGWTSRPAPSSPARASPS